MKNKIVWSLILILFIIVLIVGSIVTNKNTEKYIQGSESQSSGSVLEVTQQNFEEEVLNSEKTVVIDFYADWCGPCKVFSPIVEEVAEENEEIKVVKIDIDNEEELADQYQVMSIPTLVVIKDGEEVNRSIGVIEKSEILNMVNN